MTVMTDSETLSAGTYINLGNTACANLGAMTIIEYHKPTAPSVIGYLWAKGDSSGNGPRFIVNTSNQIALGFGSSGVINAPSKTTTAAGITFGVEQHWIGTFDGTLLGAGINIYIDAGTSLAGTAVDGSGTLSNDSGNACFLGNRTGLGREQVGLKYYTAIWRGRVLDATAIANVIANGPLSEPTGLELTWANGQDYSTHAYTASSRSTRVAGAAPTNTALGTLPTADVSGSATLDDISAAGTLTGGAASDISGGATLGDIAASGSLATAGASDVSGSATLGDITAAGTLAQASGTITSPVLKNNTGTILASVTGIVANVYHPTTGALVVRKTGLSSSGAGIVTITDVLIVAGTTYAYELDLSATSQGRRLPTGVAA